MEEKKVRAKFRCDSVTKERHWRKDGGFLYAFKFNAVTGGSEENESFFEATPSGTIELRAVKSDHFEVGNEYYLDFTLAEATA